jgi:hypothetical protein
MVGEEGDRMPETLQALVLAVVVGLLSGLGHVAASVRKMPGTTR